MQTQREILSDAFKNVGKEYGYETVDTEFSAFKEFKIKWTRSKGKATFMISDYLKDAPYEVLEGIARTIFPRFTGKETTYPDSMKEWVTSDKFVQHNRPTYIRRSRNITNTAKGKSKDLNDSVNRLIENGLLNGDELSNVHISWTITPNLRRVGYCSVLMKTVAISSIFDNENIPEYVLDYVVYHEMIHIRIGFNPFSTPHDGEFRREEKKFPQQKEAELYMKKLKLYL